MEREIAALHDEHIEDSRAHREAGERDPQRLKELSAADPVPVREARSAASSVVASQAVDADQRIARGGREGSGSRSGPSTASRRPRRRTRCRSARYGAACRTMSSTARARTRRRSTSRRYQSCRSASDSAVARPDATIARVTTGSSSLERHHGQVLAVHPLELLRVEDRGLLCKPSARTARSSRAASSPRGRRPATSRAARGS